MLSETELLDVVAAVFPVRGERHTVQLADTAAARWTDDGLYATFQLVVHDEGDAIRDNKEQTLLLLPARHCNARGAAYLEIVAERMAALSPDDVETLMPMDLFAPELLDAPIDVDAFRRVLDDPRARTILERRPTDAALIATIDPATRPTVPVLRDPALEARVLEHVDDPGAFAVYGDWLAQRGDPRGELVALQIALAQRPDAAMHARVVQLLGEYAWEWLGWFAWSDETDLRLEWRCGFVKTVRLGSREWPRHRDTSAELRHLAALPVMAFVEELTIEPKEIWLEDVFETIGEVGLPVATRRLSIATAEYAHLGWVEPAYRGMRRVEELRLESRSLDLGKIDLPSLRSLELVTRGLAAHNLESLRAAAWPQLEKLVLWLGDAGVDDCDVEIDHLAWILDGANLPAVRYLGLCGRADLGSLIGQLVEAPIVKQLTTLDLAGSCVGPDDVALLRSHHGAFAHLEALMLPHLAHAVAPDVAHGDIGPNVVATSRFIPVYE